MFLFSLKEAVSVWVPGANCLLLFANSWPSKLSFQPQFNSLAAHLIWLFHASGSATAGPRLQSLVRGLRGGFPDHRGAGLHRQVRHHLRLEVTSHQLTCGLIFGHLERLWTVDLSWKDVLRASSPDYFVNTKTILAAVHRAQLQCLKIEANSALLFHLWFELLVALSLAETFNEMSHCCCLWLTLDYYLVILGFTAWGDDSAILVN